MSTVEVKDQFLLIGGKKFARVLPDGSLQVKDTDRRRISERGSQFVSVTPAQIAAAVRPVVPRQPTRQLRAGSSAESHDRTD